MVNVAKQKKNLYMQLLSISECNVESFSSEGCRWSCKPSNPSDSKPTAYSPNMSGCPFDLLLQDTVRSGYKFGLESIQDQKEWGGSPTLSHIYTKIYTIYIYIYSKNVRSIIVLVIFVILKSLLSLISTTRTAQAGGRSFIR